MALETNFLVIIFAPASSLVLLRSCAVGTEADSNILKIYRMLDRNNGDSHYYQVSRTPNFLDLAHIHAARNRYLLPTRKDVSTCFDVLQGTYVNTRSISHTSTASRLNSWYQKAKDSAVGTSFDEHVMGAYRFLMDKYSVDADLFFFGFSRGAYVARFLAEMLDHVGLLSAGNEELAS